MCHEEQIKWSQFFLKKLTDGNKYHSTGTLYYKLYFSLKHICRMYPIKHNPIL